MLAAEESSKPPKTTKVSCLNHSKISIFILLATFALLFLPFCNKPLTIDDFSFISMSKGFDWNPLVGIPTESFNVGRYDPKLLHYTSSHPLLIPYVLKVLIAVFGTNEIALHLSFLVFPAVALASLVVLHRVLYSANPSQWTIFILLFASIPAFLVNAQVLMADVPFLAFLLLATAFFVFAVEKKVVWAFYLGGVSLCLATFTAYQALFFIPALFFYAWAKKRISSHLCFALLIPLLVLLVWLLLIYQRYDMFPLPISLSKPAVEVDIASGLSKSGIASELSKSGIGKEILKGLDLVVFRGKIIFFLVMTGASCLLVLILHHYSKRTLPKWGVKTLFLTIPCFIVFTYITDYSTLECFSLALLFATGVLTLATATKLCWADFKLPETRGRAVLWLSWLIVVITYNILILPFGSARYLLPILAPLVMILLEGVNWGQGRSRVIISGAILLSIGFGLSAATADMRFASGYKTMAEKVKIYRSTNETSDVWYIGAWGMQFYMDNAGARYLLADSNAPKRGDLVVIPEMPRLWVPSRRLQGRLAAFATWEVRSDLPLRLFNARSNAGFYGHLWGLLPFSFSSEPDEVFIIQRVVR